MMAKIRKMLFVFSLLFVTLLILSVTFALAGRTRVSGIRFSTAPIVGDTRVHIAGTAASDVGLAITEMSFSIFGISAGDLIQATGLESAIPSEGVLKTGVDALLSNGNYFLNVSGLSGNSLGGNEFSIDCNVPQGVPADGIFIVTATAVDLDGDASAPVTRVLRMKSQELVT